MIRDRSLKYFFANEDTCLIDGYPMRAGLKVNTGFHSDFTTDRTTLQNMKQFFPYFNPGTKPKTN